MSILTPAVKCADREYDVAISFLVVDENIAASIKGGLSGLNVFFYPHNQEDLAHVCLFHAFHAQKMAENPKFG
jgi:hypothetical protein